MAGDPLLEIWRLTPDEGDAREVVVMLRDIATGVGWALPISLADAGGGAHDVLLGSDGGRRVHVMDGFSVPLDWLAPLDIAVESEDRELLQDVALGRLELDDQRRRPLPEGELSREWLELRRRASRAATRHIESAARSNHPVSGLLHEADSDAQREAERALGQQPVLAELRSAAQAKTLAISEPILTGDGITLAVRPMSDWTQVDMSGLPPEASGAMLEVVFPHAGKAPEVAWGREPGVCLAGPVTPDGEASAVLVEGPMTDALRKLLGVAVVRVPAVSQYDESEITAVEAEELHMLTDIWWSPPRPEKAASDGAIAQDDIEAAFGSSQEEAQAGLARLRASIHPEGPWSVDIALAEPSDIAIDIASDWLEQLPEDVVVGADSDTFLRLVRALEPLRTTQRIVDLLERWDETRSEGGVEAAREVAMAIRGAADGNHVGDTHEVAGPSASPLPRYLFASRVAGPDRRVTFKYADDGSVVGRFSLSAAVRQVFTTCDEALRNLREEASRANAVELIRSRIQLATRLRGRAAISGLHGDLPAVWLVRPGDPSRGAVQAQKMFASGEGLCGYLDGGGDNERIGLSHTSRGLDGRWLVADALLASTDDRVNAALALAASLDAFDGDLADTVARATLVLVNGREEAELIAAAATQRLQREFDPAACATLDTAGTLLVEIIETERARTEKELARRFKRANFERLDQSEQKEAVEQDADLRLLVELDLMIP